MSTGTTTSTNLGPEEAGSKKSSLRSRLMSKSNIDVNSNPDAQKSTEELLVEKLDRFLSSIESRLDSFDQYFKFNDSNQNIQNNDDVDPDKLSPGVRSSSRSRSNSASSLSSIKSFSESNLNMIHQHLKLIKQSVLKTSFTNLEYLYKTLDDQYNYLFTSGHIMSPGPPTGIDSKSPSSVTSSSSPDSPESNRKEILSKKIITTIQFLDVKLNQVENLIQTKTPQAKIDYNKISKFKYFKFYNFNKALKNAETDYLHYYELPLSWRENRYIINGYRFSLNHSTMLKSIFHFNHNETMNIWTHLIGFFIVLYVTFVHYPSTNVYQMNTATDNLALYGFLGASMACLLSSTVWHTYSCFAKLTVRAKCACVDYTGITVLITASVVTAEYCSLYNYPKLLQTYVIFSIFCGVTGFSFNWSPYFDKPECRSVRIGFFVGLAFLGVTAFFCLCFYDGFIKSLWFFSPLMKSFMWYKLGVVFYGGLIPERWRYDVIINEDDSCNHAHTSTDVLAGDVENSGREEIGEIESEIQEQENKLGEFEEDEIISRDLETPEPEEAPENDDADHNNKYKDILDKHFPLSPTKTPYHEDFMSLWWVDYFLSSHNIWHICVVLGILGHYVAILEMYENIDRVIS